MTTEVLVEKRESASRQSFEAADGHVDLDGFAGSTAEPESPTGPSGCASPWSTPPAGRATGRAGPFPLRSRDRRHPTGAVRHNGPGAERSPRTAVPGLGVLFEPRLHVPGGTS
ncbi:hypothetical protein CKY47_22565 [Saccharothrix yanglingensis]|uniref:Uncharacterized protein n=1 Tax=Saccharothrix yanglingensis TaxID=659496 RepID=A0ABU0X642_9PSEU|nr:hypothetical protein [Saccharothrix yanglingensis]